MKKTTLFEARKGGYYNYRIPGITVTPNGTALAYCEARRDDGGDHDVIDIRMRRSTDGGATWDEPFTIADHADFPEPTMNNFVCIPDQDEDCVHALFCNLYHRAYYIRSDDDGATWSDPVEITDTFEAFRDEYDWTILAFGPGHGIQLSSGRLISSIWVSLGTTFHLPNRCGVVYSDDHGKTWQAGELVPETFPNCNETTAVELADGDVLLNMRFHEPDRDLPDDQRRRVITRSRNGATGWSTPTPDPALLEPVCHAAIVRHPEGILFTNPDTLDQELSGRWSTVRDRKNLTVQLSEDEGESWGAKRVIEPGPSGYSDLAVNAEGTVLCLYEDGMFERMADTARLTLAQFTVGWVKGNA